MKRKFSKIFFCFLIGVIFVGCSKPSAIRGNNPEAQKIKLTLKDSVAGLPLIEFPAQGNSDTMAIVLSGDGGWKTLVDSLAHYFVSKNIATVGIDTKKDFWEELKPHKFSRQLLHIYNYYSSKWHKKYIIFSGFSMGSDVLSFGVSRLPHSIKKYIAGVVLIAPSQSTKFEINIINYVIPYRNGSRVLPEVKKLRKLPLFLIFDDNPYSLSLVIKKTKLNYIKLPGGHHFGEDYGKLNQIIGRFLNLETDESSSH